MLGAKQNQNTSRKRFWSIGVLLLAIGMLFAACDADWTDTTNSNAKTGPDPSEPGKSYQEYRSIVNPVLGVSSPGSVGTAADDFCYAGANRPYVTPSACVAAGPGDGHRGLDIFSPVSAPPLVSPIDGIVVNVCPNANNNAWLVILGDDGHYYHLLHMANGSNSPSVGDTVEAGERVGRMGDRRSCSSATPVGQHLHLEMRLNGDNDPVTGPRDPYLSVRWAYARPGLLHSDPVSFHPQIETLWNQLSAFSNAPELVGWPTASWEENRPIAEALPNVKSIDSNAGSIQYVTDGLNDYAPSTWEFFSGALTHNAGSTFAYWIHGPHFQWWLQNAAYLGNRGWPTSSVMSSGVVTWVTYEQGCSIQVGNNPVTLAPPNSTLC